MVHDSDGQIAWYWESNERFEDPFPGPVIQRSDYSLVAVVHSVGLVEFSPLGTVGHKILDSENGYFHHDLRELGDGSLLTVADVAVTMDLSEFGLGEGELVAVTTIRQINFDTGRDEIIWNALAY